MVCCGVLVLNLWFGLENEVVERIICDVSKDWIDFSVEMVLDGPRNLVEWTLRGTRVQSTPLPPRPFFLVYDTGCGGASAEIIEIRKM